MFKFLSSVEGVIQHLIHINASTMRRCVIFILLFYLGLSLCHEQAVAGGKLIGSSGVSQMEGSAGGGLVPWATITGYGTRDEQSTTIFSSFVDVDDYKMRAFGLAHGFNNRIEISAARLEVKTKDDDSELKANILGLKVRLMGDLMFTPWPQVALGAQYKHGLNPNALNASSDSAGYDVYIAATKVWLDGPFHRNVVVNTTLRYSNANQLGLLGFGGDRRQHREVLFEASAGLFLNRHWVIGGEYRQKPNNFLVTREDDWKNIFVGYIPNKQIAMTLAFVGLGDIGGQTGQQGGYLSWQLSY
jgi:hypothetical protein